jgi:hypothetical protein
MAAAVAASTAAAASAAAAPSLRPAAASAAQALGKHEPQPAGVPGLEGLGRGPADVASTLQGVATRIEAEVPLVGPMAQVMPAADFLFGGAMLLWIVLLHATGMRVLTNHFERRLQGMRVQQSTWRPDILLVVVVALMLTLHLLEIFAWSAALVWSGLVAEWRAAGFFAANTYTTVGYGSFVLPDGWHMLAPIIAISGLFTFGWTGSVLVEVVRRCQEVKSAALQGRNRQPSPREGVPPQG